MQGAGGKGSLALALLGAQFVISVEWSTMNRPLNVRALRPQQPQTRSSWPSELGIASTSGTSPEMRYAYFPQNRRLAVEWHGVLTIYDTAEYQFRGMLQAHSAETVGISIWTQRGRVRLADLATVAPRTPPPEQGSPNP
jgi:hypothetical protein